MRFKEVKKKASTWFKIDVRAKFIRDTNQHWETGKANAYFDVTNGDGAYVKSFSQTLLSETFLFPPLLNLQGKSSRRAFYRSQLSVGYRGKTAIFWSF